MFILVTQKVRVECIYASCVAGDPAELGREGGADGGHGEAVGHGRVGAVSVLADGLRYHGGTGTAGPGCTRPAGHTQPQPGHTQHCRALQSQLPGGTHHSRALQPLHPRHTQLPRTLKPLYPGDTHPVPQKPLCEPLQSVPSESLWLPF